MNDFETKAKALSRYFKGKGSSQRARDWLGKVLEQPCPFCGVELNLKNIELDHWIPKASHFNPEIINNEENFVACCRECNIAKGNFTGAEFNLLMNHLDIWENKCIEGDMILEASGKATKSYVLTALKNMYKIRRKKC